MFIHLGYIYSHNHLIIHSSLDSNKHEDFRSQAGTILGPGCTAANKTKFPVFLELPSQKR
jgi:hypothetical protein